MILDKCPHCGTSHVQVEIRATENFTPSSNANGSWSLVRCQNPECAKIILLTTKERGGQPIIYPPMSFELDEKIVTNTEIRDSYREAGLCLSSRCFKASAVMSRRVLQTCLKEQGCKQRNLIEQIDHAITSNILRAPLHKLATEIRQYGNLGAHPDDKQLDKIDEEKATHIIRFVKLIIDEFYELPAIAQKLERDRQTQNSSNI
jgi:hypothetical protein